jgi:hypothetical protein
MINTMKNNLTIFCFFALALVLALGSCRKKKCYDPTNRDCENYDPCYGKKTANFGFTFGSQWGTEEYFLGIKNYVHNKDSLFGNKERLKFTAHSIYDSVKWKLGSEIITEKSFVRIFRDVPEGYYQCQMIGYRAKQSCIINDDGVDTVVKRWYMMPIPKLPIIGKFKVLFSGAKDSSIVEVLPWETYKYYRGIYPNGYFELEIREKNTNSGHITLVNFLNDGDTTASRDFILSSQIFSGHWMVFNDQAAADKCPEKGYFSLVNNSVVAEYSAYFFDKNGKVIDIKYSFKGRKLN